MQEVRPVIGKLCFCALTVTIPCQSSCLWALEYMNDLSNIKQLLQ